MTNLSFSISAFLMEQNDNCRRICSQIKMNLSQTKFCQLLTCNTRLYLIIRNKIRPSQFYLDIMTLALKNNFQADKGTVPKLRLSATSRFALVCILLGISIQGSIHNQTGGLNSHFVKEMSSDRCFREPQRDAFLRHDVNNSESSVMFEKH